ncbi:hypothetical protein C8R43DRAFT_1005630 [Mycena crocata]|nr:hypothetical protein C8R43DRAFT_1005630 [Mycena crocata]
MSLQQPIVLDSDSDAEEFPTTIPIPIAPTTHAESDVEMAEASDHVPSAPRTRVAKRKPASARKTTNAEKSTSKKKRKSDTPEPAKSKKKAKKDDDDYEGDAQDNDDEDVDMPDSPQQTTKKITTQAAKITVSGVVGLVENIERAKNTRTRLAAATARHTERNLILEKQVEEARLAVMQSKNQNETDKHSRALALQEAKSHTLQLQVELARLQKENDVSANTSHPTTDGGILPPRQPLGQRPTSSAFGFRSSSNATMAAPAPRPTFAFSSAGSFARSNSFQNNS